jgi:hypothetical protein
MFRFCGKVSNLVKVDISRDPEPITCCADLTGLRQIFERII